MRAPPLLALLPLLALAAPARAHAECEKCNQAREGAGAEAASPRVVRSTHAYATPDLTLIDQDGRKVRLADLLAPGRPVVLNFVFTTCTTICPVMSSTFAALRTRLGPAGEALRMVSISIDPERDSPEVLHAYAARLQAPAEWRFLTGEARAVRAVLGAFEATTPARTSHKPLTFLRGASGDWVRIEGLAGAADLAREVEALPAAPRPARTARNGA